MSQKKRQFSDEFKAEAVSMVLNQGLSRTEVCRSLGLCHSVLRRWINNSTSTGEITGGTPVKPLTAEQKRIEQLEKQVRQLQQERDILKKSTAFFVKELKL